MLLGLIEQSARFSLHGSTYTTLDDPLAGNGGYVSGFGFQGTYPRGISGNNIVGYYMDSSNNFHGFLYNGSTYTTLNDPLARNGTFAYGISGSNIVGYYVDSFGEHGFLYNGSTYTTLNDPLAPNATNAYGISGNNIVGCYSDSSNNVHGFIATLSSTVSWTGVKNGNWDTSTANWANSLSSTATYSNADAVIFNDTNALTGTKISNTNVTISGSVSPQSVTFNNSGAVNGGVDYTIGGGVIAGTAALIKNAAGTVTLTGANTYSGATTINGGVVQANNSAALGNSSGVTVAAGASLALQGGIAIGTIPLTLSGTGAAFNSPGALINISGNNSYAGPIFIGSGSATILRSLLETRLRSPAELTTPAIL